MKPETFVELFPYRASKLHALLDDFEVELVMIETISETKGPRNCSNMAGWESCLPLIWYVLTTELHMQW